LSRPDVTSREVCWCTDSPCSGGPRSGRGLSAHRSGSCRTVVPAFHSSSGFRRSTPGFHSPVETRQRWRSLWKITRYVNDLPKWNLLISHTEVIHVVLGGIVVCPDSVTPSKTRNEWLLSQN